MLPSLEKVFLYLFKNPSQIIKGDYLRSSMQAQLDNEVANEAEVLAEAKAYADSIISGSVVDASNTTKGIVKLSLAAAVPTNPLVVGDNDTRVQNVEHTTNKNVSGGYVGLTLFKINFLNTLGTFTSFFTNANTAARTYTLPDVTGTIALTSDIPATQTLPQTLAAGNTTGGHNIEVSSGDKIKVDDATASTIALFDASKNITFADTSVYPSLVELAYVKGVTSSIETQIGAKIDKALTAGDIIVGDVSDLAASVAMSGESTINSSGAVTLSNAAVIAKLLTGYVSGAGTISSSDSLLTAIQKLNGNIAALVSGVSSVFGRTGVVIAVSGDYNTSLVTELTNLYFTNARAIASTLTGYTSGAGTISSTDSILQAIQKLNGNIGALITGVSSVNGATGVVLVTITGTANKIDVTSGAGTTPTITISATYVGQTSITTVGTIGTGTWQGTKVGLGFGGTNADLSGTGGASNVLKQVSAGAAITVGQLAASDLSNGTTGSGAVVLATSASLVTPALGTPTALVGTNITGTASGLTAGNVTTNANLTGAVTSSGNATSLGSFTSAQLSGALTDETGSGAAVFGTSPTLVTPNLGTPSTLVLTNATGLPIAGGGTNATTAALARANLGLDDYKTIAYQALGSSIKAQALGLDISNISASTALSSSNNQRVSFIAVYLPIAMTINGLIWFQTIKASMTSNNNNRTGIYTQSGGTLTLAASSANNTNLWQTANNNTFGTENFSSPYSAASGVYFMSYIFCDSAVTTFPAFGSCPAAINSAVWGLNFGNSYKLISSLSAQTDLPSSVAMSSLTASSTPLWFGLI